MNKRAFTLIELLIVIGILGTLAVVVLVALNPIQQLARTRDAGRQSAVTQIGHALEAYAVSHDGEYPDETTTWMDTLETTGEIAKVPSAISYTTGVNACSNAAENGLCYDYDTLDGHAIIYARLESDSNNSRCTNAAAPDAYAVYSTIDGRGGIVCRATGSEPVADDSGQSFIN
jgi:prepilin-type N-terminal cleavage/methylation domain-containing protein